jgi:hypothetical protein
MHLAGCYRLDIGGRMVDPHDVDTAPSVRAVLPPRWTHAGPMSGLLAVLAAADGYAEIGQPRWALWRRKLQAAYRRA